MGNIDDMHFISITVKTFPRQVRATSRTTRRSSKLQEFTEPPSTDTDDEVDENEDGECFYDV